MPSAATQSTIFRKNSLFAALLWFECYSRGTGCYSHLASCRYLLQFRAQAIRKQEFGSTCVGGMALALAGSRNDNDAQSRPAENPRHRRRDRSTRKLAHALEAELSSPHGGLCRGRHPAAAGKTSGCGDQRHSHARHQWHRWSAPYPRNRSARRRHHAHGFRSARDREGGSAIGRERLHQQAV